MPPEKPRIPISVPQKNGRNKPCIVWMKYRYVADVVAYIYTKNCKYNSEAQRNALTNKNIASHRQKREQPR